MTREFTIVRLTTPGSRKGVETARIAEWNDGKAPVDLREVATIAQWGQYFCDCQKGQATRGARSGREATCEHVALFKTFRRQGYPSKNPNDPYEIWARVYTVDESGRIGYYKPGGEHATLSTVDRVNGISTSSRPDPTFRNRPLFP